MKLESLEGKCDPVMTLVLRCSSRQRATSSLAKRKSCIQALPRLTKKNEKCIGIVFALSLGVEHWTVDPRSLTRQIRIASHILNLRKIHPSIHLIQVREIHLLEHREVKFKPANVCSPQNRESRFRRVKKEQENTNTEQLFLLSIFVTTSAIKLIVSIDLPTTNLICTNCNYVQNLFKLGSRASKYLIHQMKMCKPDIESLNNNLLYQLIVQSLIQPWIFYIYYFYMGTLWTCFFYS